MPPPLHLSNEELATITRKADCLFEVHGERIIDGPCFLRRYLLLGIQRVREATGMKTSQKRDVAFLPVACTDLPGSFDILRHPDPAWCLLAE